MEDWVEKFEDGLSHQPEEASSRTLHISPSENRSMASTSHYMYILLPTMLYDVSLLVKMYKKSPKRNRVLERSEPQVSIFV